jgi:hypothetical protein
MIGYVLKCMYLTKYLDINLIKGHKELTYS